MKEDASRQLLELHIADAPDAWERGGFAVHGDNVVVGGIVLHLTGHGGEHRGIVGWAIDGVSDDLDGLRSTWSAGEPRATDSHPNGITVIDHVVVKTDDFDRTLPVFDAAGIERRRTRTFDLDGNTHQQCFFWLGSTILELVGPATAPREAASTSRFWGLAFTSPDLDATVEHLGSLATPVKPAVQRGRFISTLKTRDLDISVPVAIMSPHVPRSEGHDD